jgi:predicted nucleotidyltransferase
MERTLSELTEKLRSSFGQRLVAVVLYGSAVVGDQQSSFSDLNVLCVLDRLTPEEMGRAEEIFRWWRAAGNPAPLLLTRHELETSADVFTIEFHDIRREHRILYGEDVISPLVLDDRYYRAQVEHELRAKLLRLRQKVSGMLSDKDLLLRCMADSLSTFCVLFRHALLLHGVDGAMKKREVIEQAERTFGIDPLPFRKLLDIREKRAKPREVDAVGLLESYLRAIGTVIDAVDRIPPELQAPESTP